MSWRGDLFRGWAVAIIAAVVLTHAAAAQNSEVTLTILPQDIGLVGHVRGGDWTCLHVTIQSNVGTMREVVVQWVLGDIDGDRMVVEQQPVTLIPGDSMQEQSRWLYAQVDVNLNPRTKWDVQVIDAQSRQVLANQSIVGEQFEIVSAKANVIGLIGSGIGIGLEPYKKRFTQHEDINFLPIAGIENLPDRWYGLSMAQALIWTKDGGDPHLMSRTAQEALRQWVRRGGHLVIVLPYVSEPWTRSDMADLLPAVEMTRHAEQPLPEFLGRTSDMERVRLDYRELTPAADVDGKIAVLLTHDRQADGSAGRPLVVAQRYGFGRVTMIGVDLTDPRLRTRNLPNGSALWRAVFGWRSPALALWQIQEQLDSNSDRRMIHYDNRADVSLLASQIERAMAMRETATIALMLAILLFIVYWLAAGPLGFSYLRGKHLLRHSWIAFTAVVGVVTVIAWGGAFLLRPSRTTMKHFTVLDVDTATNQVHAHSWGALFVPTHGTVPVAVDPELKTGNVNVLGSAGVVAGAGAGGFLNPQRYGVSSASPSSAALPFRSTSKQLEIDYFGELPNESQWVNGKWALPRPANEGLRTQTVAPGQTLPVGTLVHDLPQPLSEVLLVYCPGNGGDPLVYRLGQSWQPGQVLQLSANAQWGRLVIDAHPTQKRALDREGYLGTLMAKMANLRSTVDEMGEVQMVETSSEQLVSEVEMMTFYSMLPPPDYRNASFTGSHSYVRPAGRSLDMTALTATRQLLVIGHLPNAPLPIPLSVDGATVPSEGWTVVRSICPVR